MTQAFSWPPMPELRRMMTESRDTFTWPPMPEFRRMLAEGRDIWIAELLGANRNIVRSTRKLLQVAPHGRGGSPGDRNRAREQFMAKWARYRKVS